MMTPAEFLKDFGPMFAGLSAELRLTLLRQTRDNHPQLREVVYQLACQFVPQHSEEFRPETAPAPAEPPAPEDPPISPENRPVTPLQADLEPTCRVDRDTARIAIGLRLAAAYRVWLVAQEHRRRNNPGKQHMTRHELFAALKTAGVKTGRRNLNKILKTGAGIFWTFHQDKVYFVGTVKIAARLVTLAVERDLPGLVATNRPGGLPVYLAVSGSLGLFEARCFAAWVDGKQIAIETLSNLFNRTRQQIFNWRRRAKINITENHSQTANKFDMRIPNEGVYAVHVKVNGKTTPGIGWRMSNTYHNPETVREHPRRGQGAKARKVCKTVLQRLGFTSERITPQLCGLKRYWTDSDALKRSLRRKIRDAWHRDYLLLGEQRPGRNKHELMTPGEWYPNTGILRYRRRAS